MIQFIFMLALAGDISEKGSAIEVESYRCEVTSSRSIQCINIGRICTEARAKAKKQSDHYLGCALDEWKKTHPKESCPADWYHSPMECSPIVFGIF